VKHFGERDRRKAQITLRTLACTLDEPIMAAQQQDECIGIQKKAH
jgi:hypothetical protein